jgi:hypothetical protein
VTSLALKRAVTSPYKAADPFDNVTDPPTKQAILALPVQYQAISRLEFSAGIMVPVRPFHSYSTSAVASGGVVTGNVIQENLTYTAVPLALVNIGIHQALYKKQPPATGAANRDCNGRTLPAIGRSVKLLITSRRSES